MGQDSNDSEDPLRRATAGDAAALGAPWERHRARLWQTVRLRLDRKLQGHVDPSDVLQDASLDLASRPGDSARERPMPTYLWMRLVTGPRLIPAHRQHLGVARRDAGCEVALDRGTLPQVSSAPLAAELLGRLNTASQVAVRAERQVQLQEALNGMKPGDPELLAPRHFEGPSNGESAEVLGLSKTAANNRYIRALGRLRELLEHVPGCFEGG
jgi:RNA polymerase sigma-70 factor (ECF subfamily)